MLTWILGKLSALAVLTVFAAAVLAIIWAYVALTMEEGG